MPETELPPLAFDRLDEVKGRLRPPLALFLDYDGTLSAIAPRPELATLDERCAAALRGLIGKLPVAVVTGRGLDDVKERMAGVDGLTFAANHGLQISGPGFEHTPMPELEAVLSRAAEHLERRLATIDGVLVEPKGFSVATHYRLVDDARVPEVEVAVREVADAHPELQIGPGKRVLELRPKGDWHKGKAIAWLRERWGAGTPVFIGDDRTDEDGFRVVEGDGLGLVVGEPEWPSHAHYRLRDISEVAEFLESLPL